MTDKEIKDAIETMRWNMADYDKGNESGDNMTNKEAIEIVEDMINDKLSNWSKKDYALNKLICTARDWDALHEITDIYIERCAREFENKLREIYDK